MRPRRRHLAGGCASRAAGAPSLADLKIKVKDDQGVSLAVVLTSVGVAVTAATADGPRQYLLRTREPLEAAHLAPAKLE